MVESRHPAAYNLRSTPIPANKESMKPRSLKIACPAIFLCAAALCLFSSSAVAQPPAEIEALASRTAQRISKTHQQHIFVASLKECQLDTEACALFETSLRANLEKAIPGVHLVKRESVINILEGRGFIALDASFPEVLKAVATSAGADILVTDTLEWQSDGYELASEVFDAVQLKKLDQFHAKIARLAPDSGGEPLVFKDPESGNSVIIPRGKQPRNPVIEFPVCDRCPNPPYTTQAQADRIQGRVLLIATVTEQGVTDRIGVIDGLADGLTDDAIEAVRAWRFRAAIGKDGKPFATRMPLEVTFRLQ